MTGLPGLSALVVAGGASSRLGTDKRTVQLGSTTLLERAAALLAAVSDDVMIAIAGPSGGDPERRGADTIVEAGIRAVRDPVPDRGPMAGILAGLQQARSPRLLVIPVDMPLLTASFLRFLGGRDPDAAVTVPRWRAGLEPLVAVYHRHCLGEMADRVDRGDTALHSFISSTALAVRLVGETEIEVYGEPERLFLNINTPDDLIRAERLLRAPPPPPGRP
jgi:molybdenum cofactor guanylyltransferase